MFKRRRKGKTNYLKRMNLLKGNSPRIIFRKTNRYVVSQYVSSKNAQDKVEININSKHLEKYGWPKEFSGSLKSIPSCYLTGFLIGKKILKEKKKTPLVDFGIMTPKHKTRPYAFLKGLIDAGIQIPNKPENKKIFPGEERIKGKDLKKDFSNIFDKIKSNIEKE